MARAFLLDTNVLLDYADPERSGHSVAFSLVEKALSSDAKLLATPGSLKDLYYILIASEKRRLRSTGAEPSAEDRAAIIDYAFALLDAMTSFMTVTSNAPNDPRMAIKLRKVHSDFEDNLLLAASMNLPECTLVTSDLELIQHSPISALTPADATALLDLSA